MKKKDNSGVLIPAGLLIGIGIGFLTGQIPAWTLIGLGAGFLAMFLFKNK
jgi:hypothetical protein